MEFNPKTEVDFLENDFFVQWVLHPNEESERYWNRWLKNHPDKVLIFSRAKDVLLSFSQEEEKGRDDEKLESILDHVMVHHQDRKRKVALKDNRKKFRLFKIDRGTAVMLAACLALVLLFTATSYFELQHVEDESEQIVWITKKTAKGAKSTFFLPDGTKVKLNSSSELSFPSTFSDSLREVKLVGQGFFDVTRNESKPFNVSTHEFNVKVLGTSFDVDAYSESNVQQVTVLTGKVAVETHEGISELVLPSERVSLSVDKKELIKTNVDAAFLSGWKDGVIVFEQQKYAEVFKDLEEWYGVDIEVQKGVELSGTFSGHYENESLENILKGISYTKHFQFQIENKQVTIRK
ncbi:FecR family protein [Echinicola salinicaeni]|uniref:FecR family protein n=1 Tax=Echinicola salinicaeni TaxID=2762757 RepID=UPI00164952F5|nr:FecR family protein [Echinicola salinicaeni]